MSDIAVPNGMKAIPAQKPEYANQANVWEYVGGQYKQVASFVPASTRVSVKVESKAERPPKAATATVGGSLRPGYAV